MNGIILSLLLLLSGQFTIPYRTTSAVTPPACGTYTHYRVITVPTQSGLSGNLTNYPVLVSNTYAYLATVANGGLVQNSNGYDVGFFTDNTCATKLPWETETYTAASGLVNYWVQVPTISHTGAITFVMAYDNSGITTDQSNPTGVWPATFQGVYHLPNGTTLTYFDSTSNANTGANSSTPATATTGEIDGAAAFGGSSHIILNPTSSGDNLVAHGAAWTNELWVNGSSFANAYNCVLCEREDPTHTYATMVKSNGKLALYLVNSAGAFVDYDGTGSHTLSANTWYLIAFTYDNSAGLIGYVNGASDGTAAANGSLATIVNFEVALGYHPSVSSRTWNGSLDEARVADTALSADWILTDYNSQSSPSTFYSVGSQF